MPFHFKALSAALSIIAAAVMVGPGRAQESPPAAAQEPAPNAAPQDGPTRQAPPAGAPVRAGRAGSAAVIANVNLRSGPGTDSDVVTTIPAGSTGRGTSCSGAGCGAAGKGHSG